MPAWQHVEVALLECCRGRKKAALTYVVTYVIGCATKHWDMFAVLLVGRLFCGVATSLLYSAFESWLVAEHFKVCAEIPNHLHSSLPNLLMCAPAHNHFAHSRFLLAFKPSGRCFCKSRPQTSGCSVSLDFLCCCSAAPSLTAGQLFLPTAGACLHPA